VLDDPFQGLPGQVQAVEVDVAVLERGHEAQRLGVVVEAAVGRHHLPQRVLAGVAEGRMAEVMGERQGLRHVLVQIEGAADRAGNLRDLQAVGQARAEVVALVVHEDLGLVLEPTERRGVDDPIPVPLEAGSGGAFRLGVESTAALLRPRGIGSQLVRAIHGAEGNGGNRANQ
jgi:hypothetical protein